SATLPPTTPPAVPPPVAPPRRTDIKSVDPGLTPYSRPTRGHQSSLGPWIMAGGLVVAILIGLVVMIIVQQLKKNPHPSEVAEKFEPDPRALAILGPRQSGLGYSFQLPADFVVVTAPPTQGLPPGTQSYAWGAKTDSPAAGAECRLWVIPQS